MPIIDVDLKKTLLRPHVTLKDSAIHPPKGYSHPFDEFYPLSLIYGNKHILWLEATNMSLITCF
jgi:hypothetical protein